MSGREFEKSEYQSDDGAQIKKMCFVVVLYGEKYQWYIPLYIYSINQAYPDYDVRIYMLDSISPEVDEMLSRLPFLKNYTVIDNVSAKPEFRMPSFCRIAPKNEAEGKVHRCARWLLYDRAFEQYKAIYIGDVDIFVAKEHFDIYDQHIKHCKFMGVPFSNTSRVLDKRSVWTLRKKAKDILEYGLGEFVREIANHRRYIYRLTGLHFVVVRDYYARVLPLLDDYWKELERLVDGQSPKWNRCVFTSDEVVLYDLVKDAGFPVPELKAFGEGTISPNILIDNAEVPNYRPHHGLHLGIWRNSDAGSRYSDVIESDVYREYYRQFCELRATDGGFRLLLEQESEFVKGVIANMDKCMGKTV